MEPPLKKSLFPVQRVAKIVASRAAGNCFFFLECFLCVKDKENTGKKIENSLKPKKNEDPLGTYKLTQPVDSKRNYFLKWSGEFFCLVRISNFFIAQFRFSRFFY